MNIEEFISYAKDQGFTNIQLMETTCNEVEVSYIDEKLENNNSSYNSSYSIKAEKNNKTVKMSTDYLDKNIVDYLILKIDNEESNYEDEYLLDSTNNNNLSVNKVEIGKQLDMLKDVYKHKDKYTNIKSIQTDFYASSNKKRIVNSNNVDMSTVNESYNFYCEVLVEEGDKLVSHSNSSLKTKAEDIKINELVEQTIEEAELMINKKELSTGKVDIVLSSSVAGSILSKIMSATYANAIREKTSIYLDKKGKNIANDKITIIEDPRDNKYPGVELFDNDGIQTTKKYLVKNGVLETYLYNIKEAKLANVKSTGNAFNGIGTRNMYISPGDKTKEELFKTMKDGLYITDYMGSSGTSINVSNGNISLQIFGFVIEDGKMKCGFEPCVMTTTFDELLHNVEEIGEDLEFYSKSAASPELYIKNISIAGK